MKRTSCLPGQDTAGVSWPVRGARAATLVTAKTAILFASLVAGITGYFWLRLLGLVPRKETQEAMQRVV